ncbi:MAG: DNA repair protein [Candidatus Fimenecus sp.]
MKNNLKKLNRRELLQLLLEASEENQKLKKENKRLEDKLSDTKLIFSKAGSLADAAAQVSSLLNAAQKTADIYIKSIKATAKQI